MIARMTRISPVPDRMDRSLRGKAWVARILPVVAVSLACTVAFGKDTEKENAVGLSPDAILSASESRWLSDLDEAAKQARQQRKPLLIRATATWCPACRMLDLTVQEKEVKEALGRWICVEIDVEQNKKVVDQLGITGVPALRLQTPSGRPAGSHEGALDAKALIAWLDEHYEEARAAVDDVLMSQDKPFEADILKLISLFDRREPTVREAALRRLLPYPKEAREEVVEAVHDGNLATRLAALELLGAWNAPIAGLDPWDMESLTKERLETLDRWASDEPAPKSGEVLKASEEDLAAAAAQIDRMLKAADGEAEAISERLARYGEQLLPVVTTRMQEAATDRERMLLRALRYRLVASNSLALDWRGGLWRLASPDSDERRKAAEELATRAKTQDQVLLLELFSDTDPLVREISLRGLQNIGGAKSVAALTRLLSDPEPNVRAAVLKQLEENPHKNMLPAVLEYLGKETDPDLVVHGLRFLRALEDDKAIRGIMPLLQHESWQVRAEAAEALSKTDSMSRYISGGSWGSANSAKQGLKADISVALLKLLEDPEPFVVAKALEGLEDVDMEVAVDYLVAAAERHRSLAGTIIRILAEGEKMRPKALPHLVAFCKHEEPAIRAAAITGLAEAGVATADKQLLVGLKDPDAVVRIASANALFDMFDRMRAQKLQELEEQTRTRVYGHTTTSRTTIHISSESSPGLIGSMFETLKGAFGGKADDTKEIEIKPADEELDTIALPDEAIEASTDETEEAASEVDEEQKTRDDVLAGIVWDAWLEEFHTGKTRPKWSDGAVEPLSGLLASENVEERVAAARALVPLGQFQEALPVLLEAARTNPGTFEPVCSVLPWLPWAERKKAYDALHTDANDVSSLALLVRSASSARDRRIADLFWDELADDSLEENLVSTLQRGLVSAYSGQRYYWSEKALPPAAMRAAQQSVEKMLDSGGVLQRLVALGLGGTFKVPGMASKATAMFEDKEADEALQIGAGRFLLLRLPPSEAIETAIRMLNDPRDEIKQGAVFRLVDRTYDITDLGRGARIDAVHSVTYFSGSGGKPIVPLPPKGLKAEDIEPFYERESDKRIRAYTGYLLALFGDGRGLDELIQLWRDNNTDRGLRNFVYQAIASLDDSSKAPVLVEIYESLDSHEVSTFYWTIRIMTGSDVLRLRKRIRDEVGMAQLR